MKTLANCHKLCSSKGNSTGGGLGNVIGGLTGGAGGALGGLAGGAEGALGSLAGGAGGLLSGIGGSIAGGFCTQFKVFMNLFHFNATATAIHVVQE